MPITRSDFSQSSFRRKLIAYLVMRKAGMHTERFGFSNLRVLTVTTSAERIASMLTAVREVTGGRGSGMFLFATRQELATHADPVKMLWRTTAGLVRIDRPPLLPPAALPAS
jgi:hypothetical protein